MLIYVMLIKKNMYSHIATVTISAQAQIKTFHIAYLTSWQNNIFDHKFRKTEPENPKKLRTASLTSKFTGSYKRNVANLVFVTNKLLIIFYKTPSNFPGIP